MRKLTQEKNKEDSLITYRVNQYLLTNRIKQILFTFGIKHNGTFYRFVLFSVIIKIYMYMNLVHDLDIFFSQIKDEIFFFYIKNYEPKDLKK